MKAFANDRADPVLCGSPKPIEFLRAPQMLYNVQTLMTGVPDIRELLTGATHSSSLPIGTIHNSNQSIRDEWMRAKAETIPSNATVLDVGAGTCPYRHLFSHCDYKTHDFKKYTGVKLGDTTEYGDIDYVSDITSLPVKNDSFDIIICTEVLEHVPDPATAFREMARILRPGGRLLMTAPLGSGLHQLPFHFYGGFTPQWYEHFSRQLGLVAVEISPNGGFHKLLAQLCARVAGDVAEYYKGRGNDAGELFELFNDWLPRFLFGLDREKCIHQFTIGYHVECRKSGATVCHVDMEAAELEQAMGVGRINRCALLDAVNRYIEIGKLFSALELMRQAVQTSPTPDPDLHDALRNLEDTVSQQPL